MSLIDALSEVGIPQANPRRFKAGAVGQDQKLICPKCGGGRTQELSLRFKLDNYGGATWVCHRATCGWKGNVPSAMGQRNMGDVKPKEYKRPEAPAERPRPQAMLDWFSKRGISEKIVNKFGIYRTIRFIRQADAEVATIAFPYMNNGELVNVKYRHDYKDDNGKCSKTFAQEGGAEPTLYNSEGINPDEVIFVEGEMDVLSLAEAGFSNAVTLKDGAGATNEKSDKRFEALNTHWQELKDVSRFILAGDKDEPGQALIEELARRLGREKCRIVDWPDGCKDANDTLIKCGAEAVKNCIINARAYPIEGLYSIN